jgi:hypothetical protein
MSIQVRGLLDRWVGDPSAVDDYEANRRAITDEANRADHHHRCGEAETRTCYQAGGRG